MSTTSARPVTAADVKVTDLDNDSIIIRLHFTINHLSRWISPVHDRARLERTTQRGQPTVKELLLEMRNNELLVFPKMHLISVKNNPNLDALPPVQLGETQLRVDQHSSPLAVLGEFRRLRQSTCSLLRSLPDPAWLRVGTSRVQHDWQIRSLAEALVEHDLAHLAEIDHALDRCGARERVSPAARAHLDELLRLVPVTLRQ